MEMDSKLKLELLQDEAYQESIIKNLGYDPKKEMRINKYELMCERIRAGDHYDVTKGYRQPISDEDIEFFYDLLKDIKPIMFKMSGDMTNNVISKEEIEERDLPIDIPFQTFSIEPADDWYSLYSEKSDTGLLNANIIVVHEKAPDHLVTYTLYNFIPKDGNKNGFAFVEKSGLVFTNNDKPSDKDSLYIPIALYLSKLDNRTATFKHVLRSKVRINGKKKLIKSKLTAILIDPSKKYLDKTFGSRKIEWTHSWEVRGHWRKFSGVGKNRQSEKNVQGWTWVNSHKKGDGELLNKNRVVK